MFQFIKSKLPSFKDSAFGWDGLNTFMFSNFLIVMTLGIFFFWLLFRVIQVAIRTKITTSKISANTCGDRTILIAGLCLQNNQVTEEFKQRLDRAITLEHETSGGEKCHDRIIILGGVTGDSQISEARAGADYLQAQGMAEESLMLEDQSRHTLENMQHARSLLLTQSQKKKLPENMSIISSRYHLYRALTLAKGLNMTLQPIAAEQFFSLSLAVIFRAIKEAYYLHWYWSGKLWVYITANHKSQARIR